jgi:AcrR family transcriptional regulator
MTVPVVPAAPAGARARARAALTQEITATARRQLATDGATGLSLRAVARELGMASSAIYRYFPSRDDLLTALIIEAYDDLGEAVEAREAAVRRSDLRGRWTAIAHGVRDWALAHPHEYALIYGSPVPGYAAPELTIGPASRVTRLLVALLVEMRAAGHVPPRHRVPRAVHAAISSVHAFIAEGLPPELAAATPDDDLVVRGLMAWTYLFGAVSFELFGHRHNVVVDDDAFFSHEIERIAELVGLG